MKEAEFLELLNLYLDHEISAADSARLEAEVQANAERRRVYEDYCRMQKACTLLAKDFVDEPVERKIVAFPTQRSGWSIGWVAGGGLAAAAACVALVVMKNLPKADAGVNAPTPAMAATVAPAPVAEAVALNPDATASAPGLAEPAAQIAHTVTMPARRSEARTVPVMLAGSGVSGTPAQFQWLHEVQLTPIQRLPMEDVRLDARSSLQPASRTYSSGRPIQGNVEMAAFKIQK